VLKLNKNLRITIRVESSEREKIEQLINEGKFKNLSQVVREALKDFLSKQNGEPKP